MNMRILMATGIIFLNFLVLSSFADEQDDFSIYSSKLYKNKTRPFCDFEHDAHNDVAGIDACEGCHHVYENGQNVEGESSEDQYCSDCHGLKASDENGISLTKAFHLKCKSCHEKKWKGPVLCGECHIKK